MPTTPPPAPAPTGPDAAAVHEALVAPDGYQLDQAAWTSDEWAAALRAGLARLLQSECRIGPGAGCYGCLDLACHEAYRALTGEYPD